MSSSTTGSYADFLSQKVSEALGKEVKLKESLDTGLSGGGGAFTSTATDEEGKNYFIKSATGKIKMLQAEYLGVSELAATKTIRVPNPICFGEHRGRGFAVFEYLNLTRGGSEFELGVQLAKMHRRISKDGFGFHVDNTIGATTQPNLPWMNDWADFWDDHRLGHMLRLTNNLGFEEKKIAPLRAKTRELLSHKPAPSLVHGDLWGGNKAYCSENGKKVPVIFDPATYYGDREVDVAMTELFGGYGADFYKGYESEWPLPPGYDKRKTVYNLYHVLNHFVLFGGGYRGQARNMIEDILRF